MSPLKQEPLHEVLQHFPIQVMEIKNESYKEKKGVWWIQTPEGYKILKKISNSESTLQYLLSAVRHLTQKGIEIPHVNETTDGKDYVNMNGTCYVLSDAIEGKNPTYSSPQELMKIVRELAKFHRASQGFIPPPGTKPKVHLGLWIEDYQAQLDDMNTFYIKESSAADSVIGRLIQKEFPHFSSRAQNAIKGLKGPEYKNWVEKGAENGCLCHQDFAAGNLLLTPQGKIYVLDTDSLTLDIPARDIRKLLNKIMKKAGKWDLELTRKVLCYYQTENPLEREEWKVVQWDLMFPHLFIGAMNKYYYQRDKEWTTEKYHQRIKEMSLFEKSIQPILENFDTLLP